MIVVADASPLVALALCDSFEAKRQGLLSSIKPQINILKSSQIYFAQNLLNHALKMAGEAEKGTG